MGAVLGLVGLVLWFVSLFFGNDSPENPAYGSYRFLSGSF